MDPLRLIFDKHSATKVDFLVGETEYKGFRAELQAQGLVDDQHELFFFDSLWEGAEIKAEWHLKEGAENPEVLPSLSFKNIQVCKKLHMATLHEFGTYALRHVPYPRRCAHNIIIVALSQMNQNQNQNQTPCFLF